jgi:hypothetical protein
MARISLRRVILWRASFRVGGIGTCHPDAQSDKMRTTRNPRHSSDCGLQPTCRAGMPMKRSYAVGCRSRGRALRPKNSAWLATA